MERQVGSLDLGGLGCRRRPGACPTITLFFVPLLLLCSCASPEPRALRLEIEPGRLPADGAASAALVARDAEGEAVRARYEVVEGRRAVRIEGGRVFAGTMPGAAVIEARAPGFAPARSRIETVLAVSDFAGDGTPDFLRLGEADRDAFVSWFTYLAESQYFAASPLPEVADCAALVRFAYRESLREHDGRWAGSLGLASVPPLAGVKKYRYPLTALGASLFRTTDGPFAAQDLSRGAFAEFADAKTLIRYNCHVVSRDLRRALPGDLLFYRQLDQNLPYHMMVYLGPSRFENGGEWVVYHTGPTGDDPGEMRRPALQELLRHPKPQWRPLPGNPNFAGVYRWNILREGAH